MKLLRYGPRGHERPGLIDTPGIQPGVGLGQEPQSLFLREGDSMRLGIDGLGEQRQRVVGWRSLGDTVLP